MTFLADPRSAAIRLHLPSHCFFPARAAPHEPDNKGTRSAPIVTSTRTRDLLCVLCVCVLAATIAASSAHADTTYDFANLTPTADGTVAYTDWYAAGNYVTFTIKPDSNYPCGSEYYWLEVNGTRVGQFNSNCAVSVFLRTPGRYSWRTILYVFETATTVTGSVTSFIVATPITTGPATVPTADPPADVSPPTARVLRSYGYRGAKAKLEFRVIDNSGAATVTIEIERHGRRIGTVRSGPIAATGSTVYLPWLIPRSQASGPVTFCMVAKDTAGNTDASRCNTLSII